MRRRPALLLTLVAAAAVATGCTTGSDPAPTPTTTGAPTTTSVAPTTTTAAPTTPLVTVTPAVNDTTILATPLEGSTVEGPTVEVSGEATAFEGTLSWLVYPAGGNPDDPAQQGSAMTGANGEVAPFSFTIELEPGRWVVQVFEASAKDGTPLRPVAVTFTVS